MQCGLRIKSIREKGETMLNFDDYKVFLGSIDGLVIVDLSGKIVYMRDSLARDCYVNSVQMTGQSVLGMNILDVIPTTNIMSVFNENHSEVGNFYFVEGRAIVSTRKPLYKDGEIVGAIEYDLFGEDGRFLSEFIHRAMNISGNQPLVNIDQSKFQLAKYTINSIVGSSKIMENVKDEIRAASRYNSTVLIEGKTGCGKESAAHSIHALSDRQLAPFISLNCAALPENLIETELYGYDDGTFTGGKKGGKKGKIELANGGTIFLDEINQLPMTAQPKLLRFLQEQEINRVGGDKNIRVDVRVIATSNEDLKALVKEGKFREDLYYRLNVIKIIMPTLGERKEDIPELVESIIARLNIRFNLNVGSVSPAVVEMLKNHDWPGNVRELNNALERAMNRCRGNILELEHFGEFVNNIVRTDYTKTKELEVKPLEQIKKEFERKAIVQALKLCDGNKVKTADLLKISRSLIHKKIVEYHIDRREYYGSSE